MARPTEAWLRSDVPEKYAEAMMKCRHPAGFCSYDGFCHYGGCFSKKSYEDDLTKRVERLEAKLDAILKKDTPNDRG